MDFYYFFTRNAKITKDRWSIGVIEFQLQLTYNENINLIGKKIKARVLIFPFMESGRLSFFIEKGGAFK
jgi:hypothetical protein